MQAHTHTHKHTYNNPQACPSTLTEEWLDLSCVEAMKGDWHASLVRCLPDLEFLKIFRYMYGDLIASLGTYCPLLEIFGSRASGTSLRVRSRY
jgi:hypothetical protein